MSVYRAGKTQYKKGTTCLFYKSVVVYDDAQDHYGKPDDFLNSVFVNHVSVIGQKSF